MPSRLQASPSFCFMPPESFPAYLPVKGARSVKASIFSKLRSRSAPVTLRRSA